MASHRMGCGCEYCKEVYGAAARVLHHDSMESKLAEHLKRRFVSRLDQLEARIRTASQKETPTPTENDVGVS